MAKAIQRLLRDDKGQLKVILIDAMTLQPVLNPEGYQVINGQTTYWEPVADVANPDVPSKVQLSASLLNKKIRQAEGDPRRVPVQPTAAEKQADLAQQAQRTTQAQRTISSSVSPTSTATKSTSISSADEAKAITDSPSLPASVTGEAPKERGGLTIGIPGTEYGGINPQRVTPEKTTERVTGVDVTPPEAAGNIGYSNQRAQRNQPLNPDVESKISEAVAGFFGPGYRADITSGKGTLHDKKGNPLGVGNANHPTGKAADFDVIGPDGQKVDSARMADFGEYAAAQGFTGIGGPSESYMGAGRMHLDTRHQNFAAWGGANKAKLASAYAFGNIKKDRINPGIPQPAPSEIRSEVPSAQAKPTAAQQSITSVAETVDSRPAGMRNNNPGNLKYDADVRWDGLVGPSENTDQGTPQAVFESPALGMRATAKLAANKYDLGLKTPRDIITAEKGWTPGYLAAAKNIANDMGIGLDDDLQLDKPERQLSFTRALISQEHGPASRAYTDDDIDRGWVDAGKRTDLSGRATSPTEGGVGRFGQGGLGRGLDSPSETSGIGRGSQLGHSGLLGSPGFGRSNLGSGRPSVESSNVGNRSTTSGSTSTRGYEGGGPTGGPSTGLGSKSKDKDKDGGGGFSNYAGGGEKV